MGSRLIMDGFGNGPNFRNYRIECLLVRKDNFRLLGKGNFGMGFQFVIQEKSKKKN